MNIQESFNLDTDREIQSMFNPVQNNQKKVDIPELKNLEGLKTPKKSDNSTT